MTRLGPYALAALAGALLVWLVLRAPSGPTPEMAVLQETIERRERVIASQARALVHTSAELRARDSVHVRDSVALVISRDVERPAIAAAKVDERRAGEAVTLAGATLDATVDSIGILLPNVSDSLKAQLATERGARDSFAAALRAQVDGQARLLVVTDSALASTEAALSSARSAWDAAARLAETRRVVLLEKDQLIEAWKARACTKTCTAKKVGLGVGIGVVLKVAYDLVTP